MKLFSIKRGVTDRMAIDLGSSRTVIAVEGSGIVLDEPSYITVNELSNEIVAFGQEAYDMQGREGRNLKVVAPIKGGVISDFERAREMLAHFVKEAKTGGSRFFTHAILGVVSDITYVERRALINAAKGARIHKVHVAEGGLAAALGAGIRTSDKRASAIVDIGSGSTNVTVVAKGAVIYSRSQRLGLEEINVELSDHFRRHLGIQLGVQTLESLKVALASAHIEEDADCRSVSLRGRDLQTGRPVETEIKETDIYPMIEKVVHKISKFISDTLTDVPPEVSADLFEYGITLTGGGALLNGFDAYIRDAIDLPVNISGDPANATVHGLLGLFREPEVLRQISGNESHLAQTAQLPFQA